MISTTSFHPGPAPTSFSRAGKNPALPIVAGLWRELLKGFVDPYRPELHYMRGPGPKWRERHGAAEAKRCGVDVNAF